MLVSSIATAMTLTMPNVGQDVSTVLSTEDHQELMRTVASKSAAQFSLIPSVPSTADDSLSEAGGLGESTQKAADVPIKVEGTLLLFIVV